MNYINADDYGLSLSVNNAIEKSFELGYINTASLMVNCDYAVDATKWAIDNGIINNIRLHLNLSFGVPLLESTKKTFLCSDGKFNSSILKKKYFFYLSKSEKQAIYNEIEAQIKFFISLGNVSKCLDSHRHIHIRIPVLNIIIKLCKKYNIEYIRSARNICDSGLFVRIYHYIVNKKIKKNFLSTKYFCSLDDYVNNSVNKSNIEVMVHPSIDENNNLYDMYGSNFDKLEYISKILL